MKNYVTDTIRQFESYVAGQRYITRIESSMTSDECVMTLIDLDGGRGKAERRMACDDIVNATWTTLDTAWLSACAELDKRRAHADTEPQEWRREYLGQWAPSTSPPAEPRVEYGGHVIIGLGEIDPTTIQPVIADPLDAEYDGWKLRDLLRMDEKRRNSDNVIAAVTCSCFTPAQRAAISAHWSAELRARTEAAKQEERERVVSDYEEDRP